MNSQQRAFRDQLQKLQVEASKNNEMKDEALTEIERVKHEIKAQRDAERAKEQNLFAALDKYNPSKVPSPMDVLQSYNTPGGFTKPPIIQYQP